MVCLYGKVVDMSMLLIVLDDIERDSKGEFESIGDP